MLLDGPLASSHQLDKLLVHGTAKLNEQERHIVAFLRQEPMIDLAYQLTQHFMRMMRERESQKVEALIAVSATCGVADVETFTLGLQGDFDAIDAALASPYSKGSSEEPTLISHT